MNPYDVIREKVSQEAEKLLGSPVGVKMVFGDEWVMIVLKWNGLMVDASCPSGDFMLPLDEFTQKVLEPPAAILRALSGAEPGSKLH